MAFNVSGTFPRASRAHHQAWLVPWEPGIPGIAFDYSDGTEGMSDATLHTQKCALPLSALAQRIVTNFQNLGGLSCRRASLPLRP